MSLPRDTGRPHHLLRKSRFDALDLRHFTLRFVCAIFDVTSPVRNFWRYPSGWILPSHGMSNCLQYRILPLHREGKKLTAKSRAARMPHGFLRNALLNSYLISTVAPASSNFFISSAVALSTPSPDFVSGFTGETKSRILDIATALCAGDIGTSLLHFHSCTRCFQLRLHLSGLFFRHSLPNGLRRGIDQVLRLLQAELGELAERLDDLDLLRPAAL